MARPPERGYVVSERTLRILFGLLIGGGITLLVVILLLMTLGPRGRYTTPNTQLYDSTLERAMERLAAYDYDAETGAARIPIERAMELVAERGVADLTFAQAAPPTAPPMAADDEVDAPAEADDFAIGEAVYVANCASCHQANGQGIPGVFPPLAGGHMPELHDVDGGREYLIHTILYGLQGQIVVQGQTYNGVMPPWPQLSDAQIAAVLNYTLLAWDNEEALAEGFIPYSADEVAAERGLGLSPADVYQQRQALELPE
jgi:mono/diheme cytochrome c family protein